MVAVVHNTSEQPIYDLRIHWVSGDSAVQASSAILSGHAIARLAALGAAMGSCSSSRLTLRSPNSMPCKRQQ